MLVREIQQNSTGCQTHSWVIGVGIKREYIRDINIENPRFDGREGKF